ncbi:cytochrome bd oxidase small subunit CydS [Paenibacillus pinihumi]
MALFIFLAAPITVVVVSILLLYLWGTIGHTNPED